MLPPHLDVPLARAPGTETVRLDDELFVLDTTHERYVGLAGAAGDLWDLLASGPLRAVDVLAHWQTRYADAPPVLAATLAEAVRQLQDAALLRSEAPSVETGA